jgi:hypothetical protein
VKRNKPNIAHIMVAHIAEKLPRAIILIMAHIEDRQMFTKNMLTHKTVFAGSLNAILILPSLQFDGAGISVS